MNEQQRRTLAADDRVRRSSPMSTYRLENVSENPSGRPGEPVTDPGPSGVSSRVDDVLIRLPLAEATGARRRSVVSPYRVDPMPAAG